MAPGRSYIVYPQGGGSRVVVLGPAAPANLWPGPLDSYNFAFSWWPSADQTAQTYNVYQGGIKIAQGVIPRPTYYYTAPFQLFQVVSGLSPNTTYSFYVTSVNQFGVEGLPSSLLTITTLNASNTAPTLPAAPLATYKPPYFLPTGGTTWSCTVTNETLSGGTPGTGTSNATGCSLQYALNHASYGDVFTLTAGSNYVQNVIQGGFQIPATFAGSVANGPIYIQTTGYSSIPTPGVRIDPSYASHCANIQFGDANSGCGGWGITLNPGANNVRFVGINFVPVASTTTNLMYGCVQFIPSNIGYTPASASNICFDRCLMGNSFANFGTTWSTVDCGLSNVNCNYLSVRDSYLYGFGASTNEGHGVQALGGSVHTYSNTYVEATSEAIIYGGSYIGQAQIPSDITVEDNCTLCQPAGLATATSPNVAHWAKNNFELKVGNRVMVAGNDLHYSLAGVVGSQFGRSVVLGCRDQMCNPSVNSTITGVSISGGYTTITDTSQNSNPWAVNKWVNQWISDNTGSVPGACGIITSSTGNSVTFASVQQWGTVPTMNVGDNYSICNPPTWQCPWNTVSDVTVSGGTINNVGPMAVIFAADYNIVSSTKRILLNNIQAWEGCPQYTDPSYGVQKPNSHCLEISGCVQNITFDHNTAVANFANSINPTYSTSVYYAGTGAWNYSDRCVFSNSLLDGNYVFGDGIGGGFTAAAFATDFKNSSFQNNGFFAANPGGFPGTNFGIYSYTGAGMKNFVNNTTQPANGDYVLASSSPYYSDSTTGGPIGFLGLNAIQNYVGVNIAPINNSDTQQPFLNILKQTSGSGSNYSNLGWITTTNVSDSNEEQYLQLDSDGYVTSLTASPTPPGGQVFTYVQSLVFNGMPMSGGSVPGVTQAYPSGSYTFQFQGAGTITLAGGDVQSGSLATSSPNVTVSGVTITSTQAAGITATVTCNVVAAYGIYVRVTAIPSSSNYPKAMSMVLTSYMSIYNAGQIWHPAFKAALAPFSRIRFLDALAINSAEQPITFTANLASGATSGTLSTAWSAPTGTYAFIFQTGQTIAVSCTYLSTAATWSTALSGSISTGATGGMAFWLIVPNWASRPKLSNFSWGGVYGVPWEAVIQLCNETSTDCWGQIPLGAMYATSGSYATSLAQLAYNGTGASITGSNLSSFTGLNSSKKFYLEVSNEVWNGVFGQNALSRMIGSVVFSVQGTYGGAQEWYGTMVAGAGDAFYAVYGATPFANRVIVTMGGQFAIGNGTTFLELAMNTPDWTSRAYTHHIGGIHFAPYFNASFNTTDIGTIVALGSTAGLNAIFGTAYSQSYGGNTYTSIPSNGWLPQTWQTLSSLISSWSSQPWAGLPMYGYEGGDGTVSAGGAWNSVAGGFNLWQSAVRDTRFQYLYYDGGQVLSSNPGYLPSLVTNGMSSVNQYSFCALNSPSGDWGALEAITQTISPVSSAPPKWQGLYKYSVA